MSGEAVSQSFPFSIEVENGGLVSFSNFRMAKSADWGVPFDALRFDVKIERVDRQCNTIAIFQNIVSKSGVYFAKGTTNQMIHGFSLGEMHTKQIGDITIEWPQVGKVQVWARCL